MLNLRTVHKLVVIIRSWIIDAYMGGGERYIGHFQILSKIRLKTKSRTDRIDSRGRAFISFHFEFRILTALKPGAHAIPFAPITTGKEPPMGCHTSAAFSL